MLRNNVFHDGPRSGVNYNDGAMGGTCGPLDGHSTTPLDDHSATTTQRTDTPIAQRWHTHSTAMTRRWHTAQTRAHTRIVAGPAPPAIMCTARHGTARHGTAQHGTGVEC